MARQYAAVLTALWQDEDYKALSSGAQRLYLLALSQPNVSWCGVVPFTARRWATFAPDTTTRTVTKAAAELVDNGYVLVDDDTEELWVRGFIKHNVENQPKLKQAAQREFADVHSKQIREGIARAYEWVPGGQPKAVATASSEKAESAVLGVGVRCPVSGQPPTPSEKTPTPTPPEAFVEGCRLAAVEQCASWIERGVTISNELGWIATRARNLQTERVDLLGMVAPLDSVTADEWRCVIQTGRLSEETAASHPLGCDECSGGWVYPEDESQGVHPCPNCARARRPA